MIAKAEALACPRSKDRFLGFGGVHSKRALRLKVLNRYYAARECEERAILGCNSLLSIACDERRTDGASPPRIGMISMTSASKTAVLLLDCPDRKGLVAAIVNFLVQKYDANILNLEQHQDVMLGLFFMRVEFATESATCDEAGFREAFSPLANELAMNWRLRFEDPPVRMALFVSQYLHCMADLLHRHQTGELKCTVALIVSNHGVARPMAEFYNVPFVYTPVTRETRVAAESRQLEAVASAKVDLVVLARYMQILSPRFVQAHPLRIINVHHSFLPAFMGAKPYHAAFARGVKLIGATSHYVTEDLDEGPIIEQDVTRVAQNDQLPDLIQKGRDLERLVLSRAVRWHLGHRILSYANKTVIFS
jgi:formyltetrahydrofolate deformylase